MDLHNENGEVGLPTLRTERLTLRPPRANDAKVVSAALNNYNVSRWLSVVPFPYTIEDANWFIAECNEGNFNSWHIWAGDRFIGTIGLDDGLGYWLAEDAWGQGYATEAAKAVIDYHFLSGKGDDQETCYFLGNEGSRKVLEKVGFLPTEIARQNCVAQGKDVDAQLMVLTRERWAALRDD